MKVADVQYSAGFCICSVKQQKVFARTDKNLSFVNLLKKKKIVTTMAKLFPCHNPSLKAILDHTHTYTELFLTGNYF